MQVSSCIMLQCLTTPQRGPKQHNNRRMELCSCTFCSQLSTKLKLKLPDCFIPLPGSLNSVQPWKASENSVPHSGPVDWFQAPLLRLQTHRIRVVCFLNRSRWALGTTVHDGHWMALVHIEWLSALYSKESLRRNVPQKHTHICKTPPLHRVGHSREEHCNVRQVIQDLVLRPIWGFRK